MTLSEVEQQLGIKLPKKWHEINDMGAMEWMELDPSQYSKKEFHQIMQKYYSKPGQFMMIDGDIEPIMYADYKAEINYLNELIGDQCSEMSIKLKDGIKLLPFATTGGGDFFCFIYTDDIEQAKIGQYYHDDFDTPEIIAESFEEFLYYAVLDAAGWALNDGESDDYIDSSEFKFHIDLLTDEFKAKIGDKNFDELVTDFEALTRRLADIWDKVQ